MLGGTLHPTPSAIMGEPSVLIPIVTHQEGSFKETPFPEHLRDWGVTAYRCIGVTMEYKEIWGLYKTYYGIF